MEIFEDKQNTIWGRAHNIRSLWHNLCDPQKRKRGSEGVRGRREEKEEREERGEWRRTRWKEKSLTPS